MTDNNNFDANIFNILRDKLGFQAGDTVFVDTTPDWYSDFADRAGFDIKADLPATHVHLFLAYKDELTEFLEDYDVFEVQQSIWFSWPKQPANSKDDVTEKDLRDALVGRGWTEGRAEALDDDWKGLQFVRS